MARNTFITRYIHDIDPHDTETREAGLNISWGSILAGLVTFIAVSILFSLVAAAIGLGVPDLTVSNPLDGVGMGLIIWTILSLIIAFAAAGFVAGLTASRSGFVHGFLTWALSLIAMIFLMTSVLSSAFGAVGTLLGYTGDAIGATVSTVGDAVGTMTEEAFQAVSENLQMDMEDANLDQEVMDALANSDIDQLQPEYLQSQLDATVDDVTNAGKRIVVDGEDPNQVFDEVTANIQDRVENITAEIDEEELTQVISENTDLTDQEAEEAVQNIQESYAQATEQANQLLADAETALNDMRAEAEQAIEDARVQAEEIVNATSRYSLYVFLGLLVAMVLTSFAGYAGAKTFQHQDDPAV